MNKGVAFEKGSHSKVSGRVQQKEKNVPSNIFEYVEAEIDLEIEASF